MDEPVVTFEARAGWYGLPARDVSQIALLRGLRSVPRAPALIAGVAEVHGRIVALIDFDRCLGAGEAPAPAGDAYGVVLAPPLDHLAILARAGVDIAAIPDAGLEPAGGDAGMLRGRLPVGGRLLNMIALPELISRIERAIRDSFRPAPGAAEEA